MELEKIGLNRDFIKCIGMFTMLLNHIAHALLTPGTLVYNVCIGVGYFTAITMCYFLVEGYEYTRSKKKVCPASADIRFAVPGAVYATVSGAGA